MKPEKDYADTKLSMLTLKHTNENFCVCCVIYMTQD